MSRVILMIVFALAGCRQPPPQMPIVDVPTPVIPAEPPWRGTLVTVLAAADSGHFATADSILLAFEQSELGTPEASESMFWRALLRADPRNPELKPTDARAALQAYLDGPTRTTRRTEVTILLRYLAISDSLRAAHTNFRTATESRDRAREEEMQKLREELQRTQAELDRIKRRLGSPKP
jgi:hypothetical protein